MNLGNDNIAQVVEDTQDFFDRVGVSKRDVTKIKIVAASYIIYIGVGIFMLLYLKIKYRISLTNFFRKNAPFSLSR